MTSGSFLSSYFTIHVVTEKPMKCFVFLFEQYLSNNIHLIEIKAVFYLIGQNVRAE